MLGNCLRDDNGTDVNNEFVLVGLSDRVEATLKLRHIRVSGCVLAITAWCD